MSTSTPHDEGTSLDLWFYRALRQLERKAFRRRPLAERRRLLIAIHDAIETAIGDAHVSGRIYGAGGEKRNPAEEYRHMRDHAISAAIAAFNREYPPQEARRG